MCPGAQRRDRNDLRKLDDLVENSLQRYLRPSCTWSLWPFNVIRHFSLSLPTAWAARTLPSIPSPEPLNGAFKNAELQLQAKSQRRRRALSALREPTAHKSSHYMAVVSGDVLSVIYSAQKWARGSTSTIDRAAFSSPKPHQKPSKNRCVNHLIRPCVAAEIFLAGQISSRQNFSRNLLSAKPKWN